MLYDVLVLCVEVCMLFEVNIRYVCTYGCTYVRTYVREYVCMYACMHACMSLGIYAHLFI